MWRAVLVITVIIGGPFSIGLTFHAFPVTGCDGRVLQQVVMRRNDDLILVVAFDLVDPPVEGFALDHSTGISAQFTPAYGLRRFVYITHHQETNIADFEKVPFKRSGRWETESCRLDARDFRMLAHRVDPAAEPHRFRFIWRIPVVIAADGVNIFAAMLFQSAELTDDLRALFVRR